MLSNCVSNHENEELTVGLPTTVVAEVMDAINPPHLCRSLEQIPSRWLSILFRNKTCTSIVRLSEPVCEV